MLACRGLDRSAHLFGDIDVSFVVVLETESGPVLARVDYRDIGAGRQYSARATELDPAVDGDGLTDEEATRISRAIAARGGAQARPWTVRYGDG